MQFSRAAGLLALLVFSVFTPAAGTNPLSSVLQLLDSLSAKITKEGEAEEKAYHEFVEWCEDAGRNTKFELQDAKDKKAKLAATIGKANGDAEAAASKIEELAGDIATADGELKSATEVRQKEQKDFQASEAELMESIDSVSRALSVLQREMQKHPSSFAQLDTSNTKNLVNSLSAIVDAAALAVADKTKLMALVQSQQASANEDDGDDLGAPAAAAYKAHSNNIIDVLEDLREKAEEELSSLRKAEVNSKHNYDMLKQSLSDEMAADTKNLNDEKSSKALATETKATAEGDLANNVKDIADAEKRLQTASSHCMQIAADHEATVVSRKQELEALAKAQELLTSTSSGAVQQTYSFLQVLSASGGLSTVRSKLHTRADLANIEVVTLVKRLAKQQHSSALAQLASRISAVLRFGSSAGEDPFAKVKSLIGDMITKLQAQAGSEATEKAYCDEQMAKTDAKKQELDYDISKMSAKIDKAAAASASLKAEVQQLQADLATLAKTGAETDNIRREEHAAFVQAKADLELGLEGVRKALGVLREYYNGEAAAAMLQSGAGESQPAMPEQHEKASGAGSGIIGMLEVVMSDFAKNLAVEETEEDDAQSQHDTMTQQNKITKTLKDQDVVYKTQEFKGLDQSLAELSGDRETSSSELAAVLDYDAKIKERCIAKPETYEERSRRREAEISGLKDALSILEDQTALVQHGKRGGRKHQFLGTDAQ